ncbi:hypothetical protein CHU98_g10635, partial [Xylaria longipes]
GKELEDLIQIPSNSYCRESVFPLIIQIKCSGQLSGCARCEDLALKCKYSVQKEHTRGRRMVRSISHSGPKQMAMAQQSSGEQSPRGIQVQSPSTPLSDTSQEETILPGNISTGGISSPGLNGVENSSVSFNNDGSEVMEVHHTIKSSDAYCYRDNVHLENGKVFSPINGYCFTPASQISLSNQSVDFDELFLLSPAISELEFTTQGSDISPACGRSSLTHGSHDSQAEWHLESGLFARAEGVEQTSYHPPVLVTQFSTQTTQVGIKTSENTTQKDCTCLKSVIFLINELESRTAPGKTLDTHNLGSCLDEHKKAVRQGEAFIQCEACSTLSENMIMQGLLVDRLLVFCEKIVVAYLTAVNHRLSFGQKDLFFGDFKIDDDTEWDLLFGGLIAVQLQSLTLLVERIRGAEGD